MAYDARCYQLAEEFLEDANGVYKRNQVTQSLAQRIQDCIEDFLNDEDNFPPPEPKFDTRRERDEWRHEAAEWQRLK